MSKYYIKCGTLELVYSCNKQPLDAAVDALWETNGNDVLDEHFYIDERGMKDYVTAQPDTVVIPLAKVAKHGGWELSKGDDDDLCSGK